ncbi:MAG: hypothetical protein LBD46_05265 [Endomicrobium sp.]|jgi:hypothetical protein|nr:hypothetical protein [Endomicrobium sp.]
MPNHIRNVFKKVSDPHVYKKIALNKDGDKSRKAELRLALKNWDENIKFIENEAKTLYESTK